MKWTKKAICLVLTVVVLISAASAIVEHIKSETVEMSSGTSITKVVQPNWTIPTELQPPSTIPPEVQPNWTMPTELQPTSTNPKGVSGISFTIIAVGPREFIAAGWLDENTQIIVLYHNMTESDVNTRSNEWFTSIGETATSFAI